ncbi:MAG: cysteine desulfurase NifS [Dehalococcoidales bacterium]|nr:cysteine desulfurase NifS [Dehalococcoidales bacterium]
MDYAATTPVHPEVFKAMVPYFRRTFGNPSSVHCYGVEARSAVETARKKVAELLNAGTEEIVFTSGGTESDNCAVKGVAHANKDKGNHIIISPVEHHAVLEPCRFLEKMGFKLTILPVDKYGMVDPEDVKTAITSETILVSVIYASNEVGTIQPLSEIGRITRDAGIYLHTDAVQAFGHIPIDVNRLNVDLLSMAGHKLCGPKGVGALYVRKGTRLTPFLLGGGQENGRRGSTYNVPGIVGLGKAVEIASREMVQEAERLSELRDRMVRELGERIELVKLNGHPSMRLPNNINISIPFAEGEATLISLDMEGICASAGSACNSGSLEPSPVLTAMQVPSDEARCSIRFTLGKWTTEEEIERVLKKLPGIVNKLRAMSPAYKKKLT